MIGFEDIGLKYRWGSLCSRIVRENHSYKYGIREVVLTRQIFDSIVRCYGETHRHYHTLEHIRKVLFQLDGIKNVPNVNMDAVEYALWFHDVVYDPKLSNNEELSSSLAISSCFDLGITESFSSLVSDLILSTKHTKPPVSLEEELICDIDLSILGASESNFDEYDNQIRYEYCWVSEQEFYSGRLLVLKSFLSRKEIYRLPQNKTFYEDSARANLERTCEKYEKRLLSLPRLKTT